MRNSIVLLMGLYAVIIILSVVVVLFLPQLDALWISVLFDLNIIGSIKSILGKYAIYGLKLCYNIPSVAVHIVIVPIIALMAPRGHALLLAFLFGILIYGFSAAFYFNAWYAHVYFNAVIASLPVLGVFAIVQIRNWTQRARVAQDLSG